MSKLTGKVAVVTGASKGIGASIAEHLGAAGASVVVNYSSSKAGADAVVAKITGKGGKAIAVQGNVSKQEDIERLFKETVAAYGKVDILVNNAGIYDFKPLEAITPEHFHSQYDLNVLGLLLTTQEAVKHLGRMADRSSISARSWGRCLWGPRLCTVRPKLRSTRLRSRFRRSLDRRRSA